MKFLLYIVYFFRSVALRGFINTVRLLSAEFIFEKKFGIKTSVIKKSNSTDFFHYQGAGYLVLLRLFKVMESHTHDFHFVDIGSGKGRAVFVAEFCGYTKVTGIELDEDLLEEARQNAKRYVPRHLKSLITFLHVNALTYDYKDEPTVYFLFNPFSQNVLKSVLEKIRSSTSSETWFIYMNPLFREVFDGLLPESTIEIKTHRYMEAVIYKWPGKLPGVASAV